MRTESSAPTGATTLLIINVFFDESYGSPIRAVLELTPEKAARWCARCARIVELHEEDPSIEAIEYAASDGPRFVTEDTLSAAFGLTSEQEDQLDANGFICVDGPLERSESDSDDAHMRTDGDALHAMIDGVLWRGQDHYTDRALETATIPLEFLQRVAAHQPPPVTSSVGVATNSSLSDAGEHQSESIVVLTQHLGDTGESKLEAYRTRAAAEDRVCLMVADLIGSMGAPDDESDAEQRRALLAAAERRDLAALGTLWAEYMDETFDLEEVELRG